MNASAQTSRLPLLPAMLAAMVLAAAAGGGIAMWIDKGVPLLRALAETRMAWCF